MDTAHLPALADELLAIARDATSGRAGRSTRSGRALSLRQTVLALTEGHGMDEHEANGEATLHVLKGSVRLRWGASRSSSPRVTSSTSRMRGTRWMR